MVEEKVEVLINGKWITGKIGNRVDLFPRDIVIFTDKECFLTDISNIRTFSRKQTFNI